MIPSAHDLSSKYDNELELSHQDLTLLAAKSDPVYLLALDTLNLISELN